MTPDQQARGEFRHGSLLDGNFGLRRVNSQRKSTESGPLASPRGSAWLSLSEWSISAAMSGRGRAWLPPVQVTAKFHTHASWTRFVPKLRKSSFPVGHQSQQPAGFPNHRESACGPVSLQLRRLKDRLRRPYRSPEEIKQPPTWKQGIAIRVIRPFRAKESQDWVQNRESAGHV